MTPDEESRHSGSGCLKLTVHFLDASDSVVIYFSRRGSILASEMFDLARDQHAVELELSEVSRAVVLRFLEEARREGWVQESVQN